jgi:[acyl-carrier-protein] S-malonyltransferase
MGISFAETSSEAARVFDIANDTLGFDLRGLMTSGPAEALALTEHTQPGVLVASIAALRAATEAGLPPPDFVAGHSLGEYSALVAGGALSVADAVRIVRARGRFMQEAVPVGVGAMAAVISLPLEKIAGICAAVEAERSGLRVVPANINGLDQVVIAGHSEAVQLAGERCKAAGARRVLPLEVSAPFHSPLMAPVAPRLAAALAAIEMHDSTIPVVTNVEARAETSGARFRELLVTQVTAPVRWTDMVEHLLSAGCDTFVEIGPGVVLGGLIRRQCPTARAFSVAEPAGIEAVRAAIAA